MLRIIVLLLASTTVVCAPALKVKNPHFYATQVGDVKTYSYSSGTVQYEYQEKVERVFAEGEILKIDCEWTCDDAKRGSIRMELTSEGVFRRVSLGRAEQDCVPVLRYPVVAGTTWTFEQEANPFGAPAQKTTFKVNREEQIELPAGRFVAVRVDIQHEVEGAMLYERQWHVLGIGMVKTVRNIGGQEQIEQLKSFRRAKN